MTTNQPEVKRIAEARPLARRSHLCFVCGHPIAIGSRYTRLVFLDKRNRHATPTAVKLHLDRCPAEVLDV